MELDGGERREVDDTISFVSSCNLACVYICKIFNNVSHMTTTTATTTTTTTTTTTQQQQGLKAHLCLESQVCFLFYIFN
jgi:uncharacterized Fe-S radical SAM superfamily protein PflX